MPINLLILETTSPQHNKARALGILFISLNMILMPPYLKLHLIFIALLTHAVLRLTVRYWGGFLCACAVWLHRCTCAVWLSPTGGSPGGGGGCCWGWCQFQDRCAMPPCCVVTLRQGRLPLPRCWMLPSTFHSVPHLSLSPHSAEGPC